MVLEESKHANTFGAAIATRVIENMRRIGDPAKEHRNLDPLIPERDSLPPLNLKWIPAYPESRIAWNGLRSRFGIHRAKHHPRAQRARAPLLGESGPAPTNGSDRTLWGS